MAQNWIDVPIELEGTVQGNPKTGFPGNTSRTHISKRTDSRSWYAWKMQKPRTTFRASERFLLGT
jgi:hypothetical protein